MARAVLRFGCIWVVLGLSLAGGPLAVASENSPSQTAGPEPMKPLVRVVDLEVGESREVELHDGSTATVELLGVDVRRDPLRGAVREPRATIEINGEKATLVSANYRLPREVGGVQVDCPITRGYTKSGGAWALEKDARLRLWPAGSPWIRPETFTYPVRQRWFASDTQMANEPVFVDGGDIPADKSVYYHSGLDIGGMETKVDVVAATNGLVVQVGEKSLEEHPLARPRYDVVYIRDPRGWYYRYSHLDSIDPGVELGERIEIGQKIGEIGKEGASGGWSHLHFEIKAPQPSGQSGTQEGYAFLWQAYRQRYDPPLIAVARPHRLAPTGRTITLDGSRSWAEGDIASHQWQLSDGSTATGPTTEIQYDQPGTYSEILKITDAEGNIDYDFGVVQAVDPDHPDRLPPTIHATFYPTSEIQPGEPVLFAVRTFRIGEHEGHEVWDFGDGSGPVKTQSDGNEASHALRGYAVTTHRFAKPGDYIVTVQRTNERGETATARLHVPVHAKAAQ